MKDEIKEMNLSEMLFNRDERLLAYITNLQEEYQTELDENFKLSEWLVKKQKRIEKLKEENKRSKTNWNKLQSWLVKENKKHSQIESISNIHELGRVCRIKDFEEVLHKMNKLNGGDEE